jgi:hypothetical protein
MSVLPPKSYDSRAINVACGAARIRSAVHDSQNPKVDAKAMPTIPPTFFSDLPSSPSSESQEDRRHATIAAANHMAHRCFASDGRWLLGNKPPENREWLWIAGSLLHGDASDRALGVAVIEALPATAVPWCIFANNHAITLLHRHGDQLSASARERLLPMAQQGLRHRPGNRQADYQFHGYNDNMPAKATCGLILGGEMFDDSAAVSHGVWLLRQLRDQFMRRGVISEHASPTYSALTVAYLGEIANCARDAEARSLAAKCAERMWAELLGRYHPNLGMMAGPYSRAYATDSIGQLSQVNFLLWLVLGEGVHPDPLKEMTREPSRLVLHHAGDLYFALSQNAWFATMHYEVPSYLLHWVRTRGYPHDLVATAERAEGGGTAFAASEILTTSHHEPDFALGCSDGDWSAHQAEEWFLTWRCRIPLGDVADRHCAFQRLLIDDDRPGEVAKSPGGEWSGERDWVGDYSRTHTVQAGRSSLVLVGAHPVLATREIRRLRLLLAVGEHLAPLEGIELDAANRFLWIDDGPVRIGVHFLAATSLGGIDPRLTLERRDGYALVWATLYDGPARRFNAEELLHASCGFVAEIGMAAEERLEDFRRRVQQAPRVDYECFHSRIIRWHAGADELAIAVGLRSWGVRFATINGRQVERPVWRCATLPAERLPYLNGSTVRGAYDLPYPDLAVHFAPNAAWAIHERGR